MVLNVVHHPEQLDTVARKLIPILDMEIYQLPPGELKKVHVFIC